MARNTKAAPAAALFQFNEGTVQGAGARRNDAVAITITCAIARALPA
jgi:hypothetical protein